MEIISNNLVPRSRRFHILMTSSGKLYEDEFVTTIVSTPIELHEFVNILTSYSDLFVEIIRDEVGLNRVMRLFGISDDLNTILLYPIMRNFRKIMTHEHGKYLASRVLAVCSMNEKNMFYHMTYRHALFLARDENGCNILKNVITIADDPFKHDFLELITQHAHSLCMDDLGISLIQHVLNLEFTKKNTEDDMRLHELMAEFDEIHPITSSDIVGLYKLASKLTSDPDLFVKFVKTKRGSLMIQVILGKSEEIDRMLWEAIKQRFNDVTTNVYGYHIMVRAKDAFEKRGVSIVDDQIKHLITCHAPYLIKEPHKGSFIVPQTRHYLIQLMMTSCEKSYEDEFLRMVSVPYELHKFVNILTSCWDLFVEIIRDKVGLNRVMRLLGISDDINTILLYPIMSKFPEIMTHEHGKALASRVLAVCNIHEKNMFYHITYRHALFLARDENGCNVLKNVITIADDLFKYDFLDLIAQQAYSLSVNNLGISVIQHVLNLEFTQKSTEDDTRLHELMAEFDEILSITSSDRVELHKLALKLTSDPDLFVEFVKTKRGSLMVQIILGKSEEIDRVFWEAIKQRFPDVATNSCGGIMFRTKDVLKKRGDSKVDYQLQRLIGYHALYLAKDRLNGNFLVKRMIKFHNLDRTEFMACGLQCHFIELSFLNYGSNIVEMLVGDRTTDLPLQFIVMEIINCDEDTLWRLANDEYGNRVLKKTLEVSKSHRVDLFSDLLDKLKPFLDSLRGSRGENIADIIESELEYETESDSE